MDFKKGLSSHGSNSKRTKHSNLRVATIGYKHGLFYAILNDKTILEVDAYNFNETTTVYAKPNNDKAKYWEKRINKNIPVKSYKAVSNYWSTIKPGMKVHGIIKDDKFIIKKYK